MIERILEQELTRVAAPRELWDRVNSGQRAVTVRESGAGKLVWALAVAMLLAIAIMAGMQFARGNAGPGQLAMRSSDAAEIRAWVRAQSGVDVPLADGLPASVRLEGVGFVGDAVEIAYRVNGRRVALTVSKADGFGGVSHGFVNRDRKNVTWSARGQRYTLACVMPGDMETACLICHGGGIPHGT